MTTYTHGRLIDVINHLPPGALLTSTAEMDKVLLQHVTRGNILYACDAVVRAGCKDEDGEISPDGKTIRAWVGTELFPVDAFAIQYDQTTIPINQEAAAI